MRKLLKNGLNLSASVHIPFYLQQYNLQSGKVPKQLTSKQLHQKTRQVNLLVISILDWISKLVTLFRIMEILIMWQCLYVSGVCVKSYIPGIRTLLAILLVTTLLYAHVQRGTSCLHFSHFVINCQKMMLDVYCGYCWIYTA